MKPTDEELRQLRVLRAVLGDSMSCGDLQAALLEALYPDHPDLDREECAEHELDYLEKWIAKETV